MLHRKLAFIPAVAAGYYQFSHSRDLDLAAQRAASELNQILVRLVVFPVFDRLASEP